MTFLMNIDAKILSTILANQIQEYSTIFIHHDHIGFIPETHGSAQIHKFNINTSQK